MSVSTACPLDPSPYHHLSRCRVKHSRVKHRIDSRSSTLIVYDSRQIVRACPNARARSRARARVCVGVIQYMRNTSFRSIRRGRRRERKKIASAGSPVLRAILNTTSIHLSSQHMLAAARRLHLIGSALVCPPNARSPVCACG